MKTFDIVTMPRFRGGSFEFVGRTLCDFLRENGYNCLVKYVEDFYSKHYDVVVFIGNINDSSMIRAMIKATFSHKRIFYAVTEGPYYGYLKPLSRMFTIITPSDYSRKELEDSGIRVHGIIPHGIDLEKFRGSLEPLRSEGVIAEISKLKDRGCVILLSIISEGIPRKGLNHLYEAVREVKSSQCFKLVIRGNVEPPADVRDKIITIKNPLPRNSLIMLYKLADVCVVPSLAEGFGLPIVEAFGAGKPVLSLDAPPMNEINNERTGWLVRVVGQRIVRGWPSSFRLNVPDLKDYVDKLTEAIEGDEERRGKAINASLQARLYDYKTVYVNFLRVINGV